MSLLRDSAADSDRLVRYLLGLLPEDEADRLDEQSIVDDHAACRLLSVENDLVDAYVTEALDPERRRRFESHYLVSPIRRRRVMFARRFLAAVDRTQPKVVAPVVSATQAVRSRTSATNWMSRHLKLAWPPLAVAASLVLTIGVLVLEDVNLRTGLSQALQDGEARDRRAQALSSELDAARTSNAQLTRALEDARATSSGTGRPAVADVAPPAAIVLLPQTRSLGPLLTLAVASTASVPFDLRLESSDFTRYRAVLKDQDAGRVVWESRVLAPRSTSAAVVSLFVPAGMLKPSHRYAFELAGVDAAGGEEAVGSYAFQIDQR
jgi:hypothetical protein